MATAVFCLEQQNLKEKREIHAAGGTRGSTDERTGVF